MKGITKAIALTAALLLILCSLPAVTVFAAYENTHTNTGNQAADIVAVAQTQVGYLEGSLSGTVAGSNNYTKYGVWYDNNVDSGGFSYSAWCAMFVSWCANQAGIPSSIVYYHAYCPYGVSWFKDRGLFQYSAYRGGSYTPKAGDIIYFAPVGSTVSSHVGIVRYASGGYVYTIEGNTSGQNGEQNEGGGCFAKAYSLSYERIYGYGTPAYQDNSGTSAQKLGTYIITASELNVRAGTSTDYDILGVLYKGDQVVVTELADNGWGKVALPDGTEGWASITTYGNYIGIDAIGNTVTPISSGVSYSYDTDGSITVSNNGSERGMIDFSLPLSLGTATTPYLTCKLVPSSGGYFFGLTQAGSNYYMMRDCNSGDELVAENEVPYMTGTEKLEINLSNWWNPEEDYRIDTLRFFLEPGASLTVSYFYFAASAGVVTDTAYNTKTSPAEPTITLMDPAVLSVADRTLAGSYVYDNGKLTVTADTDKGYHVIFDLNKEYKPESLKNLLVSFDSSASFNISLLVTTNAADRWFTLGEDFYPAFNGTTAVEYLPAQAGSAALNFVGCYTWNNLLPADGVSTVKQVKVSVGNKGTLTVNAIQMAANDVIVSFRDGVKKSDSTIGEDKPVLESTEYAVKSNAVSGIQSGTSVSEMLSALTSSYTLSVYDGTALADIASRVKTGMTVKVLDGDSELASFNLIVLGDVTCDGYLSTDDVRTIMISLISGSSLSEVQTLAADFNSDGTTNTIDARQMLMAISKQI